MQTSHGSGVGRTTEAQTLQGGLPPPSASARHRACLALFLKRYRHLYPGEKRSNANRLELLVREELDENDTEDGEDDPEGLNHADSEDGR